MGPDGPDTPQPTGADAANALGPEAAFLAGLDPLNFGRSLVKVAGALARRPADVAAGVGRWGKLVTQAGVAAAATGLGVPVAGPVAPLPKDHRFDDPPGGTTRRGSCSNSCI